VQNIILFFIRNNAFFAFLILEIIAISLLVSNNEKQNIVFLSTANSAAASWYATTSSVNKYRNLTIENKQLAEENARLKEREEGSYYNNKIDTQLIRDKVYLQQYRYTTATVVNNSTTRQNNYLTIDKGSLHGIKVHSGVVSAAGIVGIVTKVSPHYAVVMSVLNRDGAKISAKLVRTGHVGQIVWNGLNSSIVTLNQVSKQVKIELGDSVITSGISTIFPAGIFIGRVKAKEVEPGSAFFSVYVELSADLSKIDHVFVVDNIFRKEQEIIEGEIATNEQQLNN
jgi:rod shape-determining protein MreC